MQSANKGLCGVMLRLIALVYESDWKFFVMPSFFKVTCLIICSLGLASCVQTLSDESYNEHRVKRGNSSTVFLPDGSLIVIDYRSDNQSVMLTNYKEEKIVFHRVFTEDFETPQQDSSREVSYVDLEGNGLPTMKIETIQNGGVVKTKLYDIEHTITLKKEFSD